MRFLSPWMLLGLALVLLPPLIHLLTRRRPRPLPFGAIQLLLASAQRVVHLFRIRQILLLVVRSLLLLMIPLALARPGCETNAPALANGRPVALALVVDNSFPMSYEREGVRLFDRVKEEARALLEGLGPEDAAYPVSLSAPAEALVTEAALGPGGAQGALDALELTAAMPDLSGALEASWRFLAEASQPIKRLILVGVPTEMVMAGFIAPWPEGHAPELVLVDVAAGEDLPNGAVVDARAEAAQGLGQGAYRLMVRVANHSAQSRTQQIKLVVDDRPVVQSTMEVPAGGVESKALMFRLERPGLHFARVEGERDGLALDDERHLIMDLGSQVNVLVVNGDPRPVPFEDELYYLDRAMEAEARLGRGGVQIRSIGVESLGRTRLDGVDVVILANVDDPGLGAVMALRELLRNGGGVLFAPGDRVKAEKVNLVWSDLLPRAVRSVRVLGEGGVGLAPLSQRELGHPVLRSFREGLPSLAGARFHKLLLLEPHHLGGEDVILRYGDGTPCLVEGAVGRGKVVLYTSTLDRDWSNLCIQPGFLPLIHRICLHLAGRSNDRPPQSLLVGAPYSWPADLPAEGLEIRRPEGRVVRREPQDRGPFLATDRPGPYRIQGAPDSLRPFASGFVVNLDPKGSDLRRPPSQALTAWISSQSPGAQTLAQGGQGTSHKPVKPAWLIFLAISLALVVLESFLAHVGRLFQRRGR